MLRVRKVTDRAHIEYDKLKSFPGFVAPKNLALVPGGYEYDFVIGHPPNNWQLVYAACVPFWEYGKRLSIHVEGYFNHCIEVSTRVLDKDDREVFYDMISRHLRLQNLTPVCFCHGDLTFANCIQSGTGITFIDPGLHYGMPCRELDEAKILQSLCRWEVVRYGWAEPDLSAPMKTKPIHWVLLATHLVRLLAHNHSEDAYRWARFQLKEILNGKTEDLLYRH